MDTLCLSFALLLSPQVGPTTPLPAAPGVRTPSIVVRDTGLAVEPSQVRSTGGRRLLLPVPEARMRADLNLDGDRADLVLHVHDLVTATTVNLGVQGVILQVDGDRALVLVFEGAQGDTDLNGDGDTLDLVFHAIDLAAASVRNSSLAWAGNSSVGPTSSAGALDGDWAVLTVGENMQGLTDLDGDGISNGTVGFVWNLALPGNPVNPHLRLRAPFVALHHPFPLLVVDERGPGDRNGDGDTDDGVLHAYHGGTGTVVNTGFAVSSSTPVSALGAHSAFLVSEAGQQLDLDGDGDTDDEVAHVFDVAGTLDNLALAVEAPLIDLGAPGPKRPPAMRLTDEALVFHVSEVLQGDTDLNGNGRTSYEANSGERPETALFVHEVASGTTRNLGLSAWEFAQRDGLVAFEAAELPQDQDLNGDGSLFAHVAHIHDLATKTTWNLGLTTSTNHSNGVGIPGPAPFQLHDGWVALPALETTDFNADGDAGDAVLFLAHGFTLQLVNTGLALNDTLATGAGQNHDRLRFHDAWGGTLSFLVSEDAQGAQDLSGDGDQDDLVLHVLHPDSSMLLTSRASAVPPLLAAHGRWFPFFAEESADGIDRTGDGDLNDVVLRIARVRP